MNGIRLIFKDWKLLLSNKHGRIALSFLLIVPLIYAGFFLAGYWDPYGRLDQLPVAVVNLDKGAVMDNKSIHAGDDFVKKLKENKDLNFQFVSSKEAEKGLKDGRYYMTITIPEDFSKKVSTLMDKHPQPAQLLYKINPGKNFVASQIGSTAVKEMKTKIANSITKSYAEGVFNKMQELAKGLAKAADGAKKLNEGTTEAKNGMAQLTNGTNRLANGATQLQQGSNRLSLGAQKLEQGLQKLKQGTTNLSSGMGQLSIGHQKLENGMDQLTQGTKAWADGSVKIEQGQAQLEETAKALKAALEQYVQKHPDAVQDADMQKIIKISEGIAVATNTLHNGQIQLVEGAKKLNAAQEKVEEGMKQFGVKMNQATEGAKQLSVGAAQLANGFSRWENGFSSLSKGITALANGEQQLHNGAEKLSNGLIQLTDGTSELSTKLNEAAQKTSTIHTSDAVTNMFSKPVKLVESKLTDVPNYGSGIAPYFLSLGLYVGGIMGANILPLVRREEISGTAHFINKLGLFYSIGFIQTAIVDTLILGVFKLHVTSVPLFILFSLLVSFTFMTFILMLATVFGLVGKFAAITLLILQLATCGGTFPIELNAPIMRSIGQCLPMTYSVRGFQDVILLGDWSHLQWHTVILLSYLVGAAFIIWVTCLIQNRKSSTAPVH
ncbi:YhgE/Pip family protein [Parageobacillus toebii]|uniref:YhgE/Pip family protein n=1 Tax=Parageobacillus toebii TaxID=153151 RepID=UPI0035B55659